MRRLVILFLTFCSITASGSHIVGGEFELLHLSAYRYRLNLIIYFDLNNGNPGARDPEVTARIFRKSDNLPMMDFLLPYTSATEVSYFQPACSSGEIRTDKLIYTKVIDLPPEIYNDPGGYYVSWQRCCRNYNITNIYSNDPTIGDAAGQTFYLEFPPVISNGVQFINSSPQLFPPLNDYACPNRPYWVDFAGFDADGDSLVYSMITPRDTFTDDALPPGDAAQPGPYPPIIYRPGFSSDNIMNGSPGLAISNSGFLTVTPRSSGLFVFAVRCEEYRGGIKIGELVRDFQMLVLNNCPVADPPEITGRRTIESAAEFTNKVEISYPLSAPLEDRCITVQVADPDASKEVDNFSENIRLKAIPIGFDPGFNLDELLPSIGTINLSQGSIESFDVCFDECPLINGPYTIGLIAYDDACALPLTDTLEVFFNIAPINTDPIISTDLPQKSFIHFLGQPLDFNVFGVDADGDELVLTARGKDFDLADYGISFPEARANQEVSSKFGWFPDCPEIELDQVVNASGDIGFNKRLTIEFMLNDLDYCEFSNEDILEVNITLIPPLNAKPQISISSQNPEINIQNRQVDLVVGEELVLDVFATDSNNDSLQLYLDPEAEVPNGLDFQPSAGIGSIQSKLYLMAECSNLTESKEARTYELSFISEDYPCYFSDNNALTFTIKIRDKDQTITEFTPANVFTPNDDGVNDTYSLPDLPIDNCSGEFLSFRVQNRWGTDVYESIDRDFVWDGGGLEPTVYFYIIEFTNKQYTGTLSILY
jgi:hypothetical protein